MDVKCNICEDQTIGGCEIALLDKQMSKACREEYQSGVVRRNILGLKRAEDRSEITVRVPAYAWVKCNVTLRRSWKNRGSYRRSTKS